jgi:hypothetical protein
VQFHEVIALSLVLAALFLSAAIASPVEAVQSPDNSAARSASAPCASSIAADFPKAVLSNGLVQAVVYLPDPQKGYYRSTRFDWSGVVPCLTFKGHTYFGVWFQRWSQLYQL